MQKRDFKQELAELLNYYSKENGSDTPDFILAQYLVDVLKAFDTAMENRMSFSKDDAN